MFYTMAVSQLTFILSIVSGGLSGTIPRQAGNNLEAISTVDGGFQSTNEIYKFWGTLAPYHSLASGIDNSIPNGCTVNFVQSLNRHGARNPSLKKTKIYQQLLKRIQSSSSEYSPGFEILKTLECNFAADELNDLGRLEMANAGTHLVNRYQDLASSATPFLRAASEERVVESAARWLNGFQDAQSKINASAVHQDPSVVLSLPEGKGLKNPLSHGACPAFETGSDARYFDEVRHTFESVFLPPITSRLNEGSPGMALTDTDTLRIMELCPFLTLANPTVGFSPLCALFTDDDWANMEYWHVLNKYYRNMPGSRFGPTQGVGFVNELIARLTRQPVEDHTTTNPNLDSDPATFPLDRAIYADFTHAGDFAGIYSALGLADAIPPMPVDRRIPPEKMNGFRVSQNTPFATRLFVEKMTCAGGEGEELVRVLLNDRVEPLTQCGADELGRCTLSAFIESLDFARRGGLWEEC